MSMVAAGIGSAIAGTVGGLIDTGINTWQKYEDRDFAREEAEKQRDWAKGLADTAHQREVKDLKDAGLNPILSATGGVGATVPSGSSAATGASGSPNISGIAHVINSAASLTNNRNIDYHTTKQIYNSAGSLMKTVETLARREV